jgi:membrane protein implicated in regulation of membrane protease activity
MALTPKDVHGHALGLYSAGMLTMQGVGAALAGAVAQYVSPATAMAVMAAGSVAVTVLLAPGLRGESRTIPRQPSDGGREECHTQAGAGEMPSLFHR